MQCVIPDWMDTNFNKLVVKRFQGIIRKVLNMKSLNMDNIKELLLIFIRYNKSIVVIQENVPILKMHIGVFRSKMSVICFKNISQKI